MHQNQFHPLQSKLPAAQVWKLATCIVSTSRSDQKASSQHSYQLYFLYQSDALHRFYASSSIFFHLENIDIHYAGRWIQNFKGILSTFIIISMKVPIKMKSKHFIKPWYWPELMAWLAHFEFTIAQCDVTIYSHVYSDSETYFWQLQHVSLPQPLVTTHSTNFIS